MACFRGVTFGHIYNHQSSIGRSRFSPAKTEDGVRRKPGYRRCQPDLGWDAVGYLEQSREAYPLLPCGSLLVGMHFQLP